MDELFFFLKEQGDILKLYFILMKRGQNRKKKRKPKGALKKWELDNKENIHSWQNGTHKDLCSENTTFSPYLPAHPSVAVLFFKIIKYFYF